MNVWLDLEGTIITSWEDFLLNPLCVINIKKVTNWLKFNGITEINIFSAAIYDAKDKSTFETEMKDILERLLNVKIIKYPSIEELMILTRSFDQYRYDSVHEFIYHNGKFISFLKLCVENYNTQYHVLIDDCVDNWIMEKSNHTRIETININNLGE